MEVFIHGSGDKLEDVFSKTSEQLFIAAPFVKLFVARRLLAVVPESVEITFVTRWRLDEILCGVNDIEIFTLLISRRLLSIGRNQRTSSF